MAEALGEASGGHQLITYHPRGTAHSAWFFHGAEWLDFNMYQSGHEAKVVPVFHYAEAALQFRPRKPFVEGEPAYEDIPVRFWEYMDFSRRDHERVPPGVLHADGTIRDRSHFAAGFITSREVRRSAYWNLLAGAAGYTYGNNAVWQMFKRGEPLAIPALTDWREALRRPGAEDMRHLRTLWQSRPFHRLIPNQAMIIGLNRPDEHHRRAAMAGNGDFALIYLPSRQEVTVRLDGIRGPAVRAWWFDPRTGESRRAGTHPAEGRQLFHPPAGDEGEDWVLVLDSTSAGLPPPS
jgi:hypothetical protein